VLAFGGRTTGKLIIEQMIEAFFATEFEGGRHERRIAKLGGAR
jgi:ribose 5-phosphate isomerase B